VTPALASLLALIAAIILSITTRLNVGLVAIGLAWIIGTWLTDLGPEAVIRGFPTSLFLTLTGVTLLFACASANGTLEQVAHRAVRLARGNGAILPLLFFLISGLVASVGPGSISTVALIAPLAMAIGARAGLPHFLTALMVANGANAGNLSPFSAVGIIANSKMAEAGIGGHEAKVWFANFAAHVVVSLAAWAWLVRRRSRAPAVDAELVAAALPALTRNQIFTLLILLGWITGVLVFQFNLGLSAFAAATLLIGLRAVDEIQAMHRVPWRILLMVSGVSVLIGLLEVTGGMDLFTTLLSRLATPGTVNGVIALVTGTISIWSSTSGVVLPAFLPTVPGLIEKLGGGDALAVALSINVGSSLVDVSPLSTLGALCVAAVPDSQEAGKLFRQLLIWGLSMAVVGALLSLALAGPLARL
jgi:Na+/H+ antiporter NhaD/arsenite permease-like protein